MLKLYKSIDSVLYYHEAWTEEKHVVEHWGKIGDRGVSKEHALPKNFDEDEILNTTLASAVEAGFTPFDDDEMRVLLVEYAVVGMGSKADLKKRHSLEDRLNDLLGWTGLGNCDGGSIGSGSMEVCCYVVDFDIAKAAIESELAGTKFADYSRIYDEDA
ncbi:MAG: hypothetical protein ACREPB_03310 [Arenimonas sp.]